MRALLVVAVLGYSAIAQAQVSLPKLQQPKIKIPDKEANLFWSHPYGDETFVPCVHSSPQHPNGDPGLTIPCVHGVAQHPGGDAGPTIPCIHRSVEHPGGDETGARAPCGHGPRNFHRDGHPVMAPCTHFRTEHPNGDSGPKVPCVHLTLPHPNGDAGPNVPCKHIITQHPKGDPGPTVPCIHAVPEKSRDLELGLIFHFDDNAALKDAVVAAARTLSQKGVWVGRPRPLHVFHREPIKGDPNDNDDPFWSHYEDIPHALQLTKGQDQDAVIGTAHHELGHAVLGHRCVRISSPNGSHSIDDAKDPGLAMSEGWAQFMAAMLNSDRNAVNVFRRGRTWDFENAQTTEPNIPYSTKNELRVGCILWDVYDTHADGTDKVAVEFSELFRVFSPSLATLRSGPIMPSIGDYVSRLKKNKAASDSDLDAIVLFNTNKP